MSSKKKTAKKSAKKKAGKLPRQQQLPGVEDRKIAAIENLAMDYAEIRDQRQELNKEEAKLKQGLIDLMHSKKLKEYKRGNISVKLKIEEETVKVRVRDEDDIDVTEGEDAAVSTEAEAPEGEDAELDEEVPDGEFEEVEDEEESEPQSN